MAKAGRLASARAIVSLFIIMAAAFALPCLAQNMRALDVGQGDLVPQPRLLYPRLYEVSMQPGTGLEFRWSPHEGSAVQRDYYDFRLYKGYQMLASTLLFKKRVSPRDFSITLGPEYFADGGIYTWSLRQVYTGSVKSRKSTQSFKVIIKGQ